jgi:hypothetical protein
VKLKMKDGEKMDDRNEVCGRLKTEDVEEKY